MVVIVVIIVPIPPFPTNQRQDKEVWLMSRLVEFLLNPGPTQEGHV